MKVKDKFGGAVLLVAGCNSVLFFSGTFALRLMVTGQVGLLRVKPARSRELDRSTGWMPKLWMQTWRRARRSPRDPASFWFWHQKNHLAAWVGLEEN